MSIRIVDFWGVGFWDPKEMLNLYKTFLVMRGFYDGTFVCMDMVHPKSHRPRLKQKIKNKKSFCILEKLYEAPLLLSWKFSFTHWLFIVTLTLGLWPRLRHDKGQNGLQEVQGMVST